MKDKLYVVRKYIKAKSAADALRKEKKSPVDEIWVDEEWRKSSKDNLSGAMGFHIQKGEEQ